jgi:hypothetical protein
MATWGGYDGNILATRFQKTFIKDYLDLSGRLDVRNYDVSLNNRLFVMNDASFMGNMYINGNLTANIFVANNDVSLNNRLFVLNDASFMSNVYVNNILTVNLNLISNGDASLNSNVLVGKDISCNGNVSIGRNLTINGNLAVQNYTSQNIINTTTTNYQLVVSEDLSLNGRLAVSNDVSMNGNLFVFRDISLNGNIRINGSFLKDITINSINIGIKNSIYNTVVGTSALSNNTTGINNTAVGYESLLDSTTGSNNTGCGMQTIRTGSNTAYNNTAIGNQAIGSNTSGGNNTALGFSAGIIRVPNRTETNNTFIGENTSIKAVGYTNSTAIGAEADISGSNQIIFGRAVETVIIPRTMRHLAPPIIIRKATTTQSLANGGGIVKFPTLVYDNSYTGLGYNSTTGVFTNNNSYPICVNISASVNLPANNVGVRSLWIETYNNTTYSSGFGNTNATPPTYRQLMPFERGINNTYSQHVSMVLPLESGAGFAAYQWVAGLVAGNTINITADTTFTYPTIITIHVF